ncbi:hypothetical protein ACFSTC_30020 [Nonomuraea ferruginea]
MTDVHPAWLPPEAFRAIGSRRVLVHGDGPLARHGPRRGRAGLRPVRREPVRRRGGRPRAGHVRPPPGPARAVLYGEEAGETGAAPGGDEAFPTGRRDRMTGTPDGDENFLVGRRGGVTVVARARGRGCCTGCSMSSGWASGRSARTSRPSVIGPRCGGGCSTTGTTWTCIP